MQEEKNTLAVNLPKAAYERICYLATAYGISKEEIVVMALEAGFFRDTQGPIQSKSSPPHLSSDALEPPSA